MKKICFGNGIKAQDNKMCNLTVSIKGSLKEVYRLPNDLKNISNCFNNCTNLSVFNANIPNSVENMSNSFKSCKNLFKNISIPSNCINMAYAFSNVPANGTKFIPNKVTNITGSFENSKINEIVFEDRNADDLNNILNMASAFSNSSLESVTLLDGLKIGNAYRAFSTCPIERIRSDLNVDNGCEMFKSSNIKSVQNIKSNSANSMFSSSLYLNKVGSIESNNFYYTFDNCRSMKEMGNIIGNLAFKHTFRNCGVGDTGTDSYSNVVYLKPYESRDQVYLSFLDEESTTDTPTDRNFLYSHPLRTYSRGHGLENELNFINAHATDGTYISGYCNPDQFILDDNGKKQYKGDTGETIDLCIPSWYRTDLLDASTITSFNASNAFKGNTFNSVYLFGGNTSNAFCNANINSLYVYKGNITNAFCNSNINSLYINKNTINQNAFNSATIKNGILPDLVSIQESAFYNAKIDDLKTQHIANVGNNAFRDARGNVFNTSDGKSRRTYNVYNIYESAFQNSKVIPDFYYKFKNIGDNAFRNCVFSQSVSFVDDFNLGRNIFYNARMTYLYLTKNNSTIADTAFAGINYLFEIQVKDLNVSHFGGEFPTSLRSVVFLHNTQDPASTNKLSSVTSMFFPNGITNVQENQFRDLKNVTTFRTTNIGNIGKNAFANFGSSQFTTIKNYYNSNEDIIIQGNISTDAFNNSSIKRLSVGYDYCIENGSLTNCNSLEYLNCNISKGMQLNYSNVSKSTNQVATGSYHIGRVFGAIMNSPTSVGPNDYFLWNAYSNSYSYYLNRDKIPPTFKQANIYSYWGEYSFKGLNTLTDINYFSNISGDSRSNMDSCRINNIFQDCNSLINITMIIAPSSRRFLHIAPGIINASNSANYNISYCSPIERLGTSPSNSVYGVIGNLSYDVQIYNSAFNIAEYYFLNSVSAYNYSTNVTILPKIQHYDSSQPEYYGRYLYLQGHMFRGYTVKTDKIALSSPAIWNGALLHNDYTYYCPEDTILNGASGTYNNCTLYIDQVNTTSSNFAWFKDFTNSKIYFNGIDSTNFGKFNSNKGTGTQMYQSTFNVPTLINNIK